MKRIETWIFIILIVVYVALAILLPTNPQTVARYNISELQAKLLNLTIVIPISLIYLTALYGFLRVDEYAKKIADTKEGPHFRNIALGLMILAFNLPIASIISSLRSYARFAAPDLLPGLVVFRNHLSVILMLIAMVCIAKGVAGLLDTLKRRNAVKTKAPLYGILGPVMLATVYTWLIVEQSVHATGADNPFFLPVWIIIFTIAAPYVFAWSTGIWAAQRLLFYQAEVKGIVYRQAISRIAKGIAVIILVSVLVQCFTSLAGVLNRLELTPLLAFIYFLLILYAVGFGLVARGANKLKLIEEA